MKEDRKGKIYFIQKYRSIKLKLGLQEGNRFSNISIKAGKDYWIPINEEVSFIRRSKDKFGFGHFCRESTYIQSEIRKKPASWHAKLRGDTNTMYCLACKKEFGSKDEMVETAKKIWEGLGGKKYIAALAKFSKL